MKTDFETLKSLASHTINHLKESGMVDFEISNREALIEARPLSLVFVLPQTKILKIVPLKKWRRKWEMIIFLKM